MIKDKKVKEETPTVVKEKVKEETPTVVKEKVKEETSTIDKDILKGDIVEVKRSDFDKMLSQLEKQAKDIELLYKTADKGRISRELSKEGKDLIQQVRISLLDDTDRMVVGWTKLIVNKCEVIMGRWYEEQSTNIIMEDGEVIKMTYLESSRRTKRSIKADVIGIRQEDGKTIYKLQLPNGKVILLDKTFINRN